MEWLKKAPTPVVITLIVVCALLLLATLGGFVALTYAGKPTDDYWMFVSRVANIVTVPLAALAAGGAVSAARSANQAADQTNGHLSDKEREIRMLRGELSAVRATLAAQREEP